MSHPYVLSFLPTLTLLEAAAPQSIVLDWPDGELEFEQVSPPLHDLFQRLAGPGVTPAQLTDLLGADPADKLQLRSWLDTLADYGVLQYTVRLNALPLASAIPISSDFRLTSALADEDQPYVLSRFAWSRREDQRWVLESALAHAQIHLHAWQGVALLGELARPRTSAELAATIPGLSRETSRLFISLLLATEMLTPVMPDGQTREDHHPALIPWEFHDLLFHSRSRLGRQVNPVGATYRFWGQLDPLPAANPAPQAPPLPLAKPDLDSLIATDVPFTAVVERRSSIREPGETPLTDRQLGEFLYRAARVKQVWQRPPDPQTLTYRPYPSGGAIYELELYLVVSRCLNLATGLYHYDPFGHQLGLLSSGNPHIDALLDHAQQTLEIQCPPHVLIVLAARYQRLSWKYESMAYALMLKHVGVVLQTMYLVATAMDLAPCAVGAGDSDQFAKAAALDYYTDVAVGEFALSSRGHV